MRVLPTAIADVLLLEPVVHGDDRGFFLELWQGVRYSAHDIPGRFVQDNLSSSSRGVLRGLHYQWPSAQGKLISVLSGEVFDVAVDIRRGSPTFGAWVGVTLDAANHRQLWVPPGFAHGYQVVSESALFHYKVSAPYVRDDEVVLRWDDPAFSIAWPMREPVLSARDASGSLLSTLPPERLPQYRVA